MVGNGFDQFSFVHEYLNGDAGRPPGAGLETDSVVEIVGLWRVAAFAGFVERLDVAAISV